MPSNADSENPCATTTKQGDHNNKTGRPRFRIISAQVRKRHIVLVRKNALFVHFLHKNDHFTKTGSGQT
jgi:hypothetical protein